MSMSRVFVLLSVAVSAVSLAPLTRGQSLAQIADKEKQRREASGGQEAEGRENVIDEYSLAGYKPLRLDGNETPSDDSRSGTPGDGSSEAGDTTDSTRAEPTRKSTLEQRMERACSADPKGVVCASLRQKIRRDGGGRVQEFASPKKRRN